MFPVLFLSWVFSAVLLVSIIQLFTSVCKVWLSYKTFMQFTQYIIMQTASIPKRQYHFSLFSIFKMGYSLKNCFQCDEMQKLNMMINNYENQKTTPYLNDKSLFTHWNMIFLSFPELHACEISTLPNIVLWTGQLCNISLYMYITTSCLEQ